MTNENFRETINQRIKEIDTEYKEVYAAYQPTEKEKKLAAFLEAVWGLRFEKEELNDTMKNASVVLSFSDKNSPDLFFNKFFRRTKLQPKQKKSTPLYFLISRLADSRDYNFYFCPNIFIRPRGQYQPWERFVAASNCYFLDIDKIDTIKPVYNCTDKEIQTYLGEKYPILRDVPPSYIIMSGRGLHLYFILEHTEYLLGNKYQNRERERHRFLTSDYIRLLEGDVRCKNLNRLLRIPYSINTKYSIKTRLLPYGENEERYRVSKLEEYTKQYLPKSEVSKESQEPVKDTKESSKEKTGKKEKNATSPKKERNYKTTPRERSLIAAKAREALFTSRRNDLEKWFFSHLKDMKGRRHNFFLIYAIVLKNLHSAPDFIKRQCHKLNDMLTDPLTDKELEKNIRVEYNYQFRNETIAEWLSFTPMEIAEFECHYGKEAIKEYRRQRTREKNKREKEARREGMLLREQEEEKKKQRIFTIIEEHSDLSSSQMAKLIGCSKTTAWRWIVKYKESHP